MADLFCDLEAGNDSNNGTTFALRVRSVSSGITAARTAPGDRIKIMGYPIRSTGINGTFTNLSKNITLSAAVTKDVDMCETAWTAAANITAVASNTRYKQGSNAAKITPAAAFTTGLMAYKALGAAQDFSPYQVINFWIWSTVQLAANAVSMRLCSDTAGATTVDQFTIPYIIPANTYVAVVLEAGAALGSSIQSVALYAETDPGVPDIYIDAIFCSKVRTAADSLTLHTIVSKNTADEQWWGIQYVTGTTLTLCEDISVTGTSHRGYVGTTETVLLYALRCIGLTEFFTPLPGQSNSNSAIVPQESGSVGNISLYSGGWSRTDMSTQDGYTVVHAMCAGGIILATTQSYVDFERLWIVGGQTGAQIAASGWNKFRGDMRVCCAINGYQLQGFHSEVTGVLYSNSNGRGTFIDNTGLKVEKIIFDSLGSYGIEVQQGVDFLIKGGVIRNGASYIVLFNECFRGEMRGVVTSGNSSGFFAGQGLLTLRNCTIGEATEYTIFQSGNHRIVSINHDNVAGVHKIFTDWGTIDSEATIRHTASGIAWKLSPTNAGRNEVYPLDLKIAEVAVGASALVTLKVWLRRTNTALTAKLVVRGGQIAGVSADVTASMTAAADTWEEITITFTPTEAGVVSVEVQCYGGTTHSLYVDDFTPSQA